MCRKSVICRNTEKLAIIKTAKMRNIWNYSRFIRCALNTEPINEMRKNNSFAVFYLKTPPQLARSGYLFSCFITCLHGYKIGHEKRINKVLFLCVDTLQLMQFWHGGHK